MTALGRLLDELGDKHPALVLAAVGKAVSHANQTTPYLTPLHGRADVLKRLIVNIRAALQHVKAAAEQFEGLDRWEACCATSATGSHPSSGRQGTRRGCQQRGDCGIWDDRKSHRTSGQP